MTGSPTVASFSARSSRDGSYDGRGTEAGSQSGPLSNNGFSDRGVRYMSTFVPLDGDRLAGRMDLSQAAALSWLGAMLVDHGAALDRPRAFTIIAIVFANQFHRIGGKFIPTCATINVVGRALP